MKKTPRVRAGMALVVSGTLALAACHGDDDDNNINNALANNTLPSFVAGSVKTQTYDGSTDDLLTAGLGKTGLASATPPAIANAAQPTAAELRRLAIYSNYRALVDMSANGGYGRFWGPNVDLNGNDTLGEGKIAGKEYLAFADNGTGTKNVSLLVQIPASFNPDQPCIVTATSSGLARRVRRDLGGGRVGPETRLRGRLHRQRQRQRRARTLDQHRDAYRRHAHGREPRRPWQHFHGEPRARHRSRVQHATSRTATRSSTRTRSRIPRRTGARTHCRRSSLRTGRSTIPTARSTAPRARSAIRRAA